MKTNIASYFQSKTGMSSLRAAILVGAIAAWFGAAAAQAATVDTTGGATLNSNDPGNTYTGNGTLTVSGGGTVELATGGGTSETYFQQTGGLIDIVSGTTLRNGGWQKGDWSANNASLQVDGTLDLWDGNPVRVDALTGSGTVTIGVLGGVNWAGARSLVLGVNGGSGAFTGNIAGNSATDGGSLSVTKEGSGTQTLTGNNTYSGATTVNGGTLQLGGLVPGLTEGLVSISSSTDTTDPIPQGTVQLTARWGSDTTTGTGSNIYQDWGSYTTWGYRGFFYAATAGTYTFGKNFDDWGYLKIDGNVIINNNTWDAAVTATATLTVGWHAIDLRFGNGTGNVGPNGGTQYGGYGIAWSTDGGSTWKQFADPGDGSVLRTSPTPSYGLPAHLVNFYAFNNGNANDSVGGVNGALSGGATVSSTGGKFGNGAVYLNGTGAAVTMGALPAFTSGSQARTIAGWVQATATPPTWNSDYFGFNNGDGTHNGQFYFDNNGSGVVFTEYFNDTAVIQGFDSNWHFYAASWDGNNSDPVNVYVDGVLQTTLSAPTAGVRNDFGINIGGRTGFQGYVSSVQVYNAALTGTQITGLYHWNPALPSLSLPGAGTVTVNSGATLDSYASSSGSPINFASALVLQSGATLVASGASGANWTHSVTLNGNVTLTNNDGDGSDLNLGSPGGGTVTGGGGTIIANSSSNNNITLHNLDLTSDVTFQTDQRVNLQQPINSPGVTITKTGGDVLDVWDGVTSLSALIVNAGRLRLEGSGLYGFAGTLTLNSGSILSPWLYGDFSDSTHIVLNGGTLATENALHTVTWNGNVNVTAASTIDASLGNHVFTGVISGAGNLTLTGTHTVTFSGNNTYSGDTTVNGGTLSLGQVNSNNESSTVAIAASAGARLNLAFSDTDTVGKLFINGTQQPAGDYTSAHPSGAFTGGGTLHVTSGPADFANWITGTSFANGTVPSAKQGPNDDPANDGISNLVKYAIAGLDPTVSNGSVGTFTGNTLTFNKRQPLATDLTYVIETSPDLQPPWTTRVTQGPDNTATTISYTLPTGQGTCFERLKVIQTP